MSWQDRYSIAEFRDFKFKTESHDARGGNRLAIHEYPGRDESEPEDMGAKAKTYPINAYFIGPDYDLELNAFLDKLQIHGAAWLMHPWRGLLWVRVLDWTIHESNDKNGYGTVAVTFVPGGSNITEPVPDRVDIASAAIDDYQEAVVEDYELEPISAGSMEVFVGRVQEQLEGLRKVISLAALPLTWANQVISVIQGVKGDIAVILGIPQQYANALRSLLNALGLGGDSIPSFKSSSRPRIVARLTATALTANAVSTITDPLLKVNLVRESSLRNRLLVSAAGQIALAQYETQKDRDAVLGSMLTAIDALLPSMSDPVFQAASTMRRTLIDALMAQDLKPARFRNVINPLPATVLAYQMGLDEPTLIAQNGVRHPLFVNGRLSG